jgi:hypothetical protein
MFCLIVVVPGETESGSAGKQPDEGYPGRRCANGVLGPRLPDGGWGYFFHAHWTSLPCLQNPTEEIRRLTGNRRLQMSVVRRMANTNFYPLLIAE